MKQITQYYTSSLKLVLTAIFLCMPLHTATGVILGGHVTNGTADRGDPLIATWGIVADGTSVPSSFVPNGVPLVSDLIARLDTLWNVAAADQIADLTQRPWFAPFEEAMETFTIRTGITYTYEPNDDGSPIAIQGNGGIPGVRPDFRISGIEFNPNTALAYTSTAGVYHGEMVFNTAVTRVWNASTLRGICIHENMHAVGFHHTAVDGSSGKVAMGYNVNGPQFDDLIGLHYNYGDQYEKSGGNDTLSTATNLGTVAGGGGIQIGLDAQDDPVYVTVNDTASDFVSIDDNSDTDFYKFTLNSSQDVTIQVAPRGPAYIWDVSPSQSRFFVTAKELSDLSFRILDSSGTVIHDVANANIGLIESVTTSLSAGDYYVEINGFSEPFLRNEDSSNFGELPTQFYSLGITSAPVVLDQSIVSAKNGCRTISLGNSPAATYTIVSNPSNGTLSGTAPNLTYTPNVDYEGPDSFTFIATSGGLSSNPGTISIDVVDLSSSIMVSRVVNSAGYDVSAAETAAFRSSGISKTYDVDGDDAYGTEGYIFFSTGSGTSTRAFDTYLSGGSPWITSVSPGADYLNSIQFGAFVDFDNPALGISAAVADWAITGYARADVGAAGTWAEIARFTIDETAPTAIRIGVLAGNDHGSRIDPSGIRLSVNGSTPMEATGLSTALGMVFFDVLIRDPLHARFSLEAQRNGEDRQTAIAGITFDVIPTGFDTWVSNYPNLGDASADSDPDNDGIETLLEYVLNGNPTQSGDGILPRATVAGDNVIFSFTRLASSVGDTVQIFQYSKTLESNDWTDVPITQANTAEVTISPVLGNQELEEVTVTISNSLITEDKCFGRLKVSLIE